jgi:hypothetical protein
LKNLEKRIENQKSKINELKTLETNINDTSTPQITENKPKQETLPPLSVTKSVFSEEETPIFPSSSPSTNSELRTPNSELPLNPDLNIIIEHETAILNEIEQERLKAVKQLEIAKARLISAKEARQQAEHNHYLENNRRAIAIQNQQLELERQRTIRAGQLQEREYSKAQLKAKIQEIDNAINQLSTVKAPYSGKIRRIKWQGQDNHHISVELTLDVGGQRRDRPDPTNP